MAPWCGPRLPYVRPSSAPAAVVLAEARQPREASAAARPIRVLIVDNHTTARQGIRRILDGQPDMQVVGEAADGLAAIEQTGQLHPDVVLLDLQMPRLSVSRRCRGCARPIPPSKSSC